MERKAAISNAFLSGNLGINSVSDITEHSSPFKINQVFFNSDIFKILSDKSLDMQHSKETNRKK
jgi:hypothetical protein